MPPRYLLFAAPTFYPSPAWEDWRGAFARVEDAKALLPLCMEFGCDWYQIVDLDSLSVVAEGALTEHGPFAFDPEYVKAWQAFLAQSRQQEAQDEAASP